MPRDDANAEIRRDPIGRLAMAAAAALELAARAEAAYQLGMASEDHVKDAKRRYLEAARRHRNAAFRASVELARARLQAEAARAEGEDA